MFERFTHSARSAVVAAQEYARELRSPDIRVEHLLLGVLEEADPGLRTLLERHGIAHDTALRELTTAAYTDPLGAEDAEALRTIGIDLDAVRDSVTAHFGADALDRAVPASGRPARFGHIPFDRDTKKVLKISLREAMARKEKSIDAGHVLLAVLRAPSPTAAGLLGGGDALPGLRKQIHAHLDHAAA